MPLPGNSSLALHSYSSGTPLNAPANELNFEQGALIIDYATPALYQKTNTTDNSGMQQFATTGGAALTPASVVSSGALETKSPTAGFGFATGAGGAVTQITSITTGVTLSKNSGQITTVSSTLAAAASVVFTVTNTLVAATDVPVVAVGTYAGTGTPIAAVKNVVAGAFDVVLFNAHASAALNAAVIVNVNLNKGVAA